MIIPMFKYSFLVYHKEYETFLKSIQDIGVVHVQQKDKGADDEQTKELFHRISQLNKTIRFLQKRKPEKPSQTTFSDPLALAREVESLVAEVEDIKQKRQQLLKAQSLLSPWGDFSWASINKLSGAKVKVAFFVASTRRFREEWNNRYHIAVISEINGQRYFVVFYREGEKVELDAEPVKLPSQSLTEVTEAIKQSEEREEAIKIRLDGAVAGIPILKEALAKATAEWQYCKVKRNTKHEAENRLLILEGYVPSDREENLTAYLDKSAVFYIREEVDRKDKNVPVLLKNNKFARLFEPIGKLFSLPAYYEIDMTPFFAPFFMLFFGFCLGDAGYGLAILVAATIFKKKLNPSIQPLVTLAQFLGTATVIMGIVSGTFFGINLLDTGYTLTAHSMQILQHQNLPAEVMNKVGTLLNTHFDTRDAFSGALKNLLGADIFSKYHQPLLRYAESDYRIINYLRFVMLDSMGIFTLSLIIGAIQIIFGMCLKVANRIYQKGFVYGLSTIGWLVIILTAAGFFMSQGKEGFSPVIFYVLFGIGAFLVFFFNNPDVNVFARLGLGIWDTYGVVTGMFGDLLSYIRLFALCTSGAILGYVFDAISLQLLNVPYIGWLFFVILLIFGHTLNIALSALSSFVHPMRLTFVEFYKNAEFVGGGKAYKPFSK